MSKTKRSFVWNLAKKISLDKVECNLCSKIMSIKGGSTTNLIKHMKNKHPSESDIKSREVRSLSFKDLINKERPGSKSSKLKNGNKNISLPSTSNNMDSASTSVQISSQQLLKLNLNMRVRNEHWLMLLGILEKNPELLTNKIIGPDGKANRNFLWKTISNQLNNLGFGEKSIKSWRKTLTDWKSNTKMKAAKIKELMEKTGRTSPSLSLSETEIRLINLIEETVTEEDYSDIEIGKVEVTSPDLVNINHEVDEPYFWDPLTSPTASTTKSEIVERNYCETKNLSKATLSSIHKRKLAEESESTLQLKKRIFQKRLTQPIPVVNDDTLTLLKGIKENTESMANSLKDIATILREHLSQTK